MLNAEKYKKDIEKANYSFAIVNNEFINCFKLQTCTDCKFDKTFNCYHERFKWLLEEYTEPVLNDEGIEFLKHHIECSGKKALYIKITKKVANYYEYCLQIHLDTGLISIPFDEKSDLYKMFKEMEIGVSYAPEDLGL